MKLLLDIMRIVKTIIYLPLLLVLLANAQSLSAGYMNGGELLNQCMAYIDAEQKTDNLCPAFISGIANVHNTLVNWGGHRQEWCVPDTLSVDRLVSLVTGDLMKQAPQALIHDANSLTAYSLAKLFPCSQ